MCVAVFNTSLPTHACVWPLNTQVHIVLVDEGLIHQPHALGLSEAALPAGHPGGVHVQNQPGGGLSSGERGRGAAAAGDIGQHASSSQQQQWQQVVKCRLSLHGQL